MNASSTFLRILPLAAVLACEPATESKPSIVLASAEAIDDRTVVVNFSETIDPTQSDISGLQIINFEQITPTPLALEDVQINGRELTLKTAKHRGGIVYSIVLTGISFDGLENVDIPSQVNFTGFERSELLIRIDTRGYQLESGLELLATIDPSTGRYRETLQKFDFLDDEIPGVFTATLSVQIQKNETYALRAQTSDVQTPVSQLTSFTVTSTAYQVLELECTLPARPEFENPLDRVVGDAKAPVRIIVDDRFARELKRPKLRVSVNAEGAFDLAAATLLDLRKIPGYDRVYETSLEVQVDDERSLSGTTEATFPYIAYLVENNEDFPARGIQFEMPGEIPQTHIIPMGNPNLVPVTFRVDAGNAWLEPDGSVRGLYPQEGLFLTGEFPGAEDAFGRIAADAFTGGERTTLKMKTRPDAPNIFEKTVFMKPDRPYGWKVVRCPEDDGCAAVNRRVTSSGRAFPTVMKNLVSENLDAASNSSVKLIDPASPGDYDVAAVSVDGTETPSNAVIFKQEVPDLLVTVGQDPIITPIYVVGTWRDVNIETTPIELVEQGGVIDLNPYDYDSGWIGIAPLVRDTELPVDPGPPQPMAGQPRFSATDGVLDPVARQWTNENGRLPLWVGWNQSELYVATSPASAGSDHFIFVLTSTPTGSRNMPWAKTGNMAASDHGVFLAMEGDGEFNGWFRREASRPDARIEAEGAQSGGASVLEGALTLVLSGDSSVVESVWIAVVAIESNDGGSLRPAQQNPAGNGDFNVDPGEFVKIRLSEVRSFP